MLVGRRRAIEPEVLVQGCVSCYRAERSLPHVVMSVDEAWRDDFVGGVDCLSVGRTVGEVTLRELCDAVTFDQH